ncbi:MAG: Hsp20/alpha crystallin family protein [Phycisphaerae bacterium]|nr:Hsp20/alpha crystallin family protein [Phycisphaerae bacterium]
MIRIQAGSARFDDVILQVNHFMDQFMQKSFFRFKPCGNWQPVINLYEIPDAFYICVDLAGVDPKQVELHVENKLLHIMGHRVTPAPTGGTSARIHVMEIDHGPFCRSVNIPDGVDIDKIKAHYTQGLLWINLPKKSQNVRIDRREVETNRIDLHRGHNEQR